MDRNRHGVPLYITPKARQASRFGNRPNLPEPKHCVWPGCRNPFIPVPQAVYVCTGHAFAAGAAYLDWTISPAVKRAITARVERAEKTASEPGQGWVYYVEVGDYYKIGYATDVRRRMKDYPPNCTLLAQHRGTKADERAIHGRFAAHLDAGREWFRKDDEITQYIDAIISVYGRCIDPFPQRKVKTAQEKQPVKLRARSLR